VVSPPVKAVFLVVSLASIASIASIARIALRLLDPPAADIYLAGVLLMHPPDLLARVLVVADADLG